VKAFAVVLLVAAAAIAQKGEPVVTPVPAKEMKPGYGVVESVTPVQMRARSAAAGGSAEGAPAGQPMYRIGVRMADGSVQYRDLDKPEFKVGDNVLLTNAGDIVPD
jgi:hypothetical protein